MSFLSVARLSYVSALVMAAASIAPVLDEFGTDKPKRRKVRIVSGFACVACLVSLISTYTISQKTLDDQLELKAQRDSLNQTLRSADAQLRGMRMAVDSTGQTAAGIAEQSKRILAQTAQLAARASVLDSILTQQRVQASVAMSGVADARRQMARDMSQFGELTADLVIAFPEPTAAQTVITTNLHERYLGPTPNRDSSESFVLARNGSRPTWLKFPVGTSFTSCCGPTIEMLGRGLAMRPDVPVEIYRAGGGPIQSRKPDLSLAFMFGQQSQPRRSWQLSWGDPAWVIIDLQSGHFFLELSVSVKQVGSGSPDMTSFDDLLGSTITVGMFDVTAQDFARPVVTRLAFSNKRGISTEFALPLQSVVYRNIGSVFTAEIAVGTSWPGVRP